MTRLPMRKIREALSVQIIAELRGMLGKHNGQFTAPAGTNGKPCACSVAVAYDRVFWRSLIHVMSLRTYTPRAIENFDGRVAQVLASGNCGKKN